MKKKQELFPVFPERSQIARRFAGDRTLEDISVEDLADLQWSGLPSSSISVADLHQSDVSPGFK